MGQNLKTRLGRIRDTGRSGAGETREKSAARPEWAGETGWPGWKEAGFKTLKRVVSAELPLPLPPAFPEAFPILVPDFLRAGKIPPPEELLFFDLETTGLSGGAGTVAFLAAFGRFALSGGGKNGSAPARLEITQYLLLDYPGESDFIESAVKEFGASVPPFVVSFNGKSFDTQILKTRCLMNGIMAPEYFHADLLHPARRLWKRRLPNCSQAVIEENVLGLDRSGDVPGALAPEIWFSFLRTGETAELFSICDHNVRDIQGLASLFLALGEIAADPLKSENTFRFDGEALALAWNEALRKRPDFFGNREKETGELLLKNASANGGPRAAFALAVSFFKKGRHNEARKLLLAAAEADASNAVFSAAGVSAAFRAAVYKSLAVDAEWRLADSALALGYTKKALAVPEIPAGLANELEKRRLRLEEKQK